MGEKCFKLQQWVGQHFLSHALQPKRWWHNTLQHNCWHNTLQHNCWQNTLQQKVGGTTRCKRCNKHYSASSQSTLQHDLILLPPLLWLLLSKMQSMHHYITLTFVHIQDHTHLQKEPTFPKQNVCWRVSSIFQTNSFSKNIARPIFLFNGQKSGHTSNMPTLTLILIFPFHKIYWSIQIYGSTQWGNRDYEGQKRSSREGERTFWRVDCFLRRWKFATTWKLSAAKENRKKEMNRIKDCAAKNHFMTFH